MLHGLLPASYILPRTYDVLIKHFWPGPLTLLFPADPAVVPRIVTAQHPTVAVRMPAHPVARALIALADAPIAAPSANTSGKPSPTRAAHVARDLGGRLELILDGGACAVGLESTVVDALAPDGAVRVLRPGGATVEDIAAVLRREMGADAPRVLVHRRDFRDAGIEDAPTTPGMKYRHYAPAVPVILLHTSSPAPHGAVREPAAMYFRSFTTESDAKPARVGVLAPADSGLWMHVRNVQGVVWVPFELGTLADHAVTAQRLFDGLLTLEGEGVDAIVVEEVSEEREGLAIMNRVKKAAGESRWIDLSSSP